MSDEFRQHIIAAVAKRTGADPGSIDDTDWFDGVRSALDVLASESWVRDEWAQCLMDTDAFSDDQADVLAQAIQTTLARDA